MAIKKLGIAGPSYTSESILADCNRTVNWYPEVIEDGLGKVRTALYPTPGYSLFGTIGSGPSRGGLYVNGIHYRVSGDTVYNVNSAGSGTSVGTISNDGTPTSMAASQVPQILIISAGLGYYISGGVLAGPLIAPFPANAIECGFLDGYFIVAAADNRFYISALNDVTSWAALDSSAIQFSANTIVTMLIDKLETWIFGDRVSQAFYNSGRASFPFERVPSGAIEHGCGAANSVVKLDNSFLWLDNDNRGGGVVVRAQGYTPERVSNHAVEYAINSYPIDKSNAIAWAYQQKGHQFYMLTFPSALPDGHTWCYDAITNMWHERLSWNATLGRYEAYRGIDHTFAFNKHLIGDRVNGKVYSMDINIFTEDSSPIRRLRRCPHIYAGQRNVAHKSLWVGVETGVGLSGTSATAGYDPQLELSMSDDGGVTYSSEGSQSLGKLGEYATRVMWNRLGSTNTSRVYQLTCYEPVPVRIIDAEVDVEVM